MAIADKAAYRRDEKCDDDKDGRKRVDLGGRAMLDGTEYVYGKGLGCRPGDEKGDHKVIQGQGEGEKAAGEDSGREQWQKDFPRGSPAPGSKIAGRVDQGEIEILKAP
jgi:hypothetical protein